MTVVERRTLPRIHDFTLREHGVAVSLMIVVMVLLWEQPELRGTVKSNVYDFILLLSLCLIPTLGNHMVPTDISKPKHQHTAVSFLTSPLRGDVAVPQSAGIAPRTYTRFLLLSQTCILDDSYVVNTQGDYLSGTSLRDKIAVDVTSMLRLLARCNRSLRRSAPHPRRPVTLSHQSDKK
jgi:hypothetical protein